MTYFEDLSPYTYFHGDEDPPGTVNVGWLAVKHPFATGDTSVEFRAKLALLCERPVKQTRGTHECYFCKGRGKPWSSAEMRVSDDERTYAAPLLIHHYVVAHNYRPPQEFIDAVLQWQDLES